MLYEDLKIIENLLEGNEYSAHGVTYFVAFDKIDSSLPLDLAVKMRLIELQAIPSSETNIVMTSIEDLKNELKQLYAYWQVDEKICGKFLSMLDEGVKIYRCCDDSVAFLL